MHEPGSRLNPLLAVTSRLKAAGVAHALIGAAALAIHGISRSTSDLDLLAIDPCCLVATLWEPLKQAGVTVEIRRGDADDPLAGVARFSPATDEQVDLVVGRSKWQRDALSRAERGFVGGVELPVLRPSDLVLLKLYAGGPQDAWDVQQLLAGRHRDAVISEVEQHLAELPGHAASLWRRIHGTGTS